MRRSGIARPPFVTTDDHFILENDQFVRQCLCAT